MLFLCLLLQQQYKFIHECILCVLEGREDEATYANVGHLNVGFDGELQYGLHLYGWKDKWVSGWMDIGE